MSTHSVSLKEAASHLSDLIKLVSQGDDVVITGNDGACARLISASAASVERIAGLQQGKVHMRHDFDEPLDDNFLTGNEH